MKTLSILVLALLCATAAHTEPRVTSVRLVIHSAGSHVLVCGAGRVKNHRVVQVRR